MTNPVEPKKKRLIVIANLIHASPRMPGLLAPLARKGWDITIITPPLPENSPDILGFPEDFAEECQIIETSPYVDVYEPIRSVMRALSLVKKDAEDGYTAALKSDAPANGLKSKFINWMLSSYQSVFAYPDTEKGWIKDATIVAQNTLTKNPGALLLSTSPYPSSHIVANKIACAHQIIWVADYRDPWSQNHNYQMAWWRKLVDRWAEKRVMRPASRIISASEGFSKKLQALHKRPVATIRNGFHPSTQIAYERSNVDKVCIRYTGRVYPKFQSVAPILDALQKIRDEHLGDITKFEIEFFGPYSSEVESAVADRKLQNIVFQRGSVSRSVIRELQQKADILLLLQWENQKETGIFPLKFLEYLDAGRPILATGNSLAGEISDILRETGAGTPFNRVEDIASYLLAAYDEIASKGRLGYQGVDEKIALFSYENSAIELEELLSEL